MQCDLQNGIKGVVKSSKENFAGYYSTITKSFCSGRLITDNILIAYEMTHFLKNKRRGKEGFAAIKLDMSKAYDRVEWNFLRDIMQRLGFERRWIELVMNCVTTVKYCIRVNG